MSAEKRRNVRVAVRLLADAPGRDGEPCVYGRVRDLSLQGAFIEGLRGYEKGARCEVTILLGEPQDGPRVRAECLVARVEGTGIGVRFERVDAAGLPHLLHLLLSMKRVRPQVVQELDEVLDMPPRGAP